MCFLLRISGRSLLCSFCLPSPINPYPVLCTFWLHRDWGDHFHFPFYHFITSQYRLFILTLYASSLAFLFCGNYRIYHNKTAHLFFRLSCWLGFWSLKPYLCIPPLWIMSQPTKPDPSFNCRNLHHDLV